MLKATGTINKQHNTESNCVWRNGQNDLISVNYNPAQRKKSFRNSDYKKSRCRRQGFIFATLLQFTLHLNQDWLGLYMQPSCVSTHWGKKGVKMIILLICLKQTKLQKQCSHFPLNYPGRGSSMIKFLRESSLLSILHLCVQTLSPSSAAKICLLLPTLNSAPLQIGHIWQPLDHGYEKFCISNTCT